MRYFFHYTRIVSQSSSLHKPVCISLGALRIKITCLLFFLFFLTLNIPFMSFERGSLNKKAVIWNKNQGTKASDFATVTLSTIRSYFLSFLWGLRSQPLFIPQGVLSVVDISSIYRPNHKPSSPTAWKPPASFVTGFAA